jgi:hypothetical protein
MSVPEFTSISDLVSHLNATGPDSSNNYTVYGLKISAASVQAQVDHANKYVYSLVPSLTGPGSSDPREVSAELAALDIACLGILVTVVGGSLVGAYDYSLGDMHVARAGPYAYAIKTAIDAYRQSVIANLGNVSSVALAANSTRHIPHNSGLELHP